MINSNIKKVVLAILLMAGFAGLNAQTYRGAGAQYLRNQRGACVYGAGLSAEQQKIIQDLSTKHITAMDALRTQFWATTDPVEAASIRTKMDQLQVTHRAEIVKLGGSTPNVPRSAYRGGSRGLGRGAGLGLGRSSGRGTGRAVTGGRGLGPCGSSLGSRR